MCSFGELCDGMGRGENILGWSWNSEAYKEKRLLAQ